ncbi:hypothetical protein UE46_00050 [Listeria weihenstephanensis]|uniref:ABC transporter permease n=1 Tax=Listeria weihenstephanensis TaxID=1006155 RepID=A0A1S7FQD3_9LIST|nr:ABC transporter permease [Listeria weihenstephanensis]AQY49613.1 hypothetical protein UE46_00050 [Listeria weihenstephanensis]
MHTIKKNKFLLFVLIILFLVAIQFINYNDRMYFVTKHQQNLYEGPISSIDFTRDRNDTKVAYLEKKKALYKEVLNKFDATIFQEEANINNQRMELLMVPSKQVQYFNFPILRGKSILNYTNKVALVGKNVRNKLANKERIDINGIMYKVIGTLGAKGVINGSFDASIVIPYEAYVPDEYSYTSAANNISVYGTNNNDAVIKIVQPYFKNYQEGVDVVQILNMKTKDSETLMIGMKNFLFSMFIMLFISVIMLSYFWIEEHRMEFAVRKLVGSTNLSLFWRTLKEMIVIALLAFAIGSCVHMLAIFFDLPFLNQVRLNFYPIFLIYSILFATTLAALLSLIFRRISAVECVRERM